MDKFKEVRLKHIYREGNSDADQLDNKGTGGEDIFQLAIESPNIDNILT